MKSLKKHWRVIARVLAAILICGGALCGYWWFYKLAPSRCTLDRAWCASHSQREYWREVQKGIQRGMWFHDDGFTVGAHGDKSWMKWILDHVEPGTRLDGCMGDGLAHADSALCGISNQDVGGDADAWLAWWRKNKSTSQEEWIADGFRQRGFKVDIPPGPEHHEILLALLGNTETNDVGAVPGYLKHNAFRCLRDSGFQAVAFAISNGTVSAKVERGLLEYAKRERLWPEASGVGILPFGKKDDYWEGKALPAMLQPGFQIAANALVFGLPFLGVALLICTFRKKTENVEPEN